MQTEQGNRYINEQNIPFLNAVDDVLNTITKPEVWTAHFRTTFSPSTHAALDEDTKWEILTDISDDIESTFSDTKECVRNVIKEKLEFFERKGFLFIDKTNWLSIIGLDTHSAIWDERATEKTILLFFMEKAGMEQRVQEIYQEQVVYDTQKQSGVTMLNKIYPLKKLPPVRTPDGERYQLAYMRHTVLHVSDKTLPFAIGDVTEEVGFWRLPSQAEEDTPS